MSLQTGFVETKQAGKVIQTNRSELGAGRRDRGVGGDRAVVHDAGTGHKVRA